MSSANYNQDFELGILECGIRCAGITNPVDRVKITQWLYKISTMPSTDVKAIAARRQYLDYLCLMLRANESENVLLCRPFNKRIPNNDLPPLPELLLNMLIENCPNLSKCGPIAPVLCYQSDDGKAYMNVKRNPDGGLFCYMAVASHFLKRSE